MKFSEAPKPISTKCFGCQEPKKPGSRSWERVTLEVFAPYNDPAAKPTSRIVPLHFCSSGKCIALADRLISVMNGAARRL